MRAIYLDCFSGLSGNMLLGAFLAAGVPFAALQEELRRLPMADEFALRQSAVKKNGIAATYVEVELLSEGKDASNTAACGARYRIFGGFWSVHPFPRKSGRRA